MFPCFVPAGVFWIIWVLSSLSSSVTAGISFDIPVDESVFSFFLLSLLFVCLFGA